MQQQKEQDRRQKEEDQRKQEEEEERRKREEEIRKIRDLSNQEEQYNRFMKLVGGKRRSRSRVTNLLYGVQVLYLRFMSDFCLAPPGSMSLLPPLKKKKKRERKAQHTSVLPVFQSHARQGFPLGLLRSVCMSCTFASQW